MPDGWERGGGASRAGVGRGRHGRRYLSGAADRGRGAGDAEDHAGQVDSATPGQAGRNPPPGLPGSAWFIHP